jgi:hypothetical protein
VALIMTACGAPSPPATSTGWDPLPSISLDDLAAAVRFREAFGLRSDEAWIIQVARDPSSAHGTDVFGVPLTPAEVGELERRAIANDELQPVLESYGQRFADMYSGVWLADDGTLLILFTKQIEEHRRALGSMIQPGAKVDVREARWTLRELNAFAERVRNDIDWLPQIEAWPLGVDVHIGNNAVQLLISSANPDTAEEIAEHFGADGWLRVESDGIGRWTGPTGSLTVIAVGPEGRPPPTLDCELVPDIRSAQPTEQFGTDSDGRCHYRDIPAVGYTVNLRRSQGDTTVVVGTGRVNV